MCPVILDRVIQHEIINGYNNRNKNDKFYCGFHRISPYKYIVFSIQKEVNSEANLLQEIEKVRLLFPELNYL